MKTHPHPNPPLEGEGIQTSKVKASSSQFCHQFFHGLAADSPSTASSPLTIIGFDFGLKRIGVAVGNTLLRQATPLKVLHVTTSEAKFDAIAVLIADWKPARCVVGLPLHPDGAEHEMTQHCRRFANQLNGRFNLPVTLVDERYSSAVLPQRRGELIDAEAAALILQQYFGEHRDA